MTFKKGNKFGKKIFYAKDDMTKRTRVLELSKQEPKLTRAEIARQTPCSTAYVTNVLGAERSYTKKTKNETDVSPA